MKALGVLTFTVLAGSVFAGETTCPSVLSAKAEARLLPVLDALAAARAKQSSFDRRYQAEFNRLLDAKGQSARSARVALMDYYVGESFGEELVCAVAKDGSTALLELFERCDIALRHSPMPRERNLPLRRYALGMISRGHVTEECTYE
jgi:hypothetical protein